MTDAVVLKVLMSYRTQVSQESAESLEKLLGRNMTSTQGHGNYHGAAKLRAGLIFDGSKWRSLWRVAAIQEHGRLWKVVQL